MSCIFCHTMFGCITEVTSLPVCVYVFACSPCVPTAMSPVSLPSGDGIPDEQGWIRRKSEALSDKQRVTDGRAGDRRTRTEGRPHDITLIHAWRPCNLANLVCPTLFYRFHLPLHSNILILSLIGCVILAFGRLQPGVSRNLLEINCTAE